MRSARGELEAKRPDGHVFVAFGAVDLRWGVDKLAALVVALAEERGRLARERHEFKRQAAG